MCRSIHIVSSSPVTMIPSCEACYHITCVLMLLCYTMLICPGLSVPAASYTSVLSVDYFMFGFAVLVIMLSTCARLICTVMYYNTPIL